MKVLMFESPVELDLLKTKFSNVFELFPFEQAQDIKALKNIEAIFVKLGRKIDSTELKRFPQLKFILTPTTGLDHIDLEFCTEKNIEVLSLRKHATLLSNITSTTEVVWWHILEAVRRPSIAVQSVVGGKWDRNAHFSESLSGKRIGIIGLGRIGKQVADVARAFKMNVSFYDRVPVVSDYELQSASEIFSSSDIIVIAISDEDSNVSFVDEHLLNLLPEKGTVLINCSRGRLLAEEKLEKYLESGKLIAVGADVLADELSASQDWIKSSPLWRAQRRFPNRVRITPHIGGATYDSLRMAELAVFSELKSRVIDKGHVK